MAHDLDGPGDVPASTRGSPASPETCPASAPSCSQAASRRAASQAVGEYDGALRAIIHAFKYGEHVSLAAPLGRMMAAHGREVLAGADAVVPVPLHWLRQWKRGFNQAHLLARHLGVAVWPALRRARATRPQVALAATARQRNVSGAFRLARRWPWRPDWKVVLEGKVIVLVDDVFTTGSTLDACAAVLRAARAREVRVLTAARVVGRRP